MTEPAPRDAANAGALLKERFETHEGYGIYLHAEKCPSYCDCACNGNQNSPPLLDALYSFLSEVGSAPDAPDDLAWLDPLLALAAQATPGVLRVEGAEDVHGAPKIMDEHTTGFTARMWQRHPKKREMAALIVALVNEALPRLRRMRDARSGGA